MLPLLECDPRDDEVRARHAHGRSHAPGRDRRDRDRFVLARSEREVGQARSREPREREVMRIARSAGGRGVTGHDDASVGLQRCAGRGERAGNVVHRAATGAERGVEHAGVVKRISPMAGTLLGPVTSATPTYLPSDWRSSFFGYSVIPEPVIESTACPPTPNAESTEPFALYRVRSICSPVSPVAPNVTILPPGICSASSAAAVDAGHPLNTDPCDPKFGSGRALRRDRRRRQRADDEERDDTRASCPSDVHE